MRTKAALDLPTKTPTTDCPPAPTESSAPPKGLSFEDRLNAKKPYLARWREVGGDKKSRSFESPAMREAFAIQWAKNRATWGKAAPMVHPRQAETWKKFADLTGGADPIEVATFWLKYRRDRGGAMTVADAIVRFEGLREGQNLSGDNISHIRLHLKRFAAGFVGQRLADVSADGIRSWLAGLKNPGTNAPMEAYTLRHHLKTVRLLFKVAVTEKWTDENPTDPVQPPTPEQEEISVMPLADVRTLFEKNRNALCVGRLALEAFGGLRYTSAARLTKEDLLLAEKGVVMPGQKHKSGRRHFVDGYPENLWAWIKAAPEACWSISQRQYLDLKAEAFVRAGLKNPGNVLRHSFCTYHIAANKDAARTAVLLTHARPSMLYQHYKGRSTEADGKAYFEILPSA